MIVEQPWGELRNTQVLNLQSSQVGSLLIIKIPIQTQGHTHGLALLVLRKSELPLLVAVVVASRLNGGYIQVVLSISVVVGVQGP